MYTQRRGIPLTTTDTVVGAFVHGKNVARLVPLLALCAAIVSTIGFVSGAGYNYILFAFFFVYTVIALSMLLQVHGGADYGKLFLWAFIVRLVLTLAIEAIPPESTPGAVRYFSGVIWKDEGYYLGTARLLGQSFESLAAMNLSNPYERVAGFYGLWILLFGDATVWGRLINVLLGAITVVILYDASVQVVEKKTQYLVFWFLVLSPVLIHFSIVYLKETLLIFSISLIINAIVKLYDRHSLLPQLFKLGIGFSIGIWARNTSLVPLLLPLGLTMLCARKVNRGGKFLFAPVLVLSIVLVGLIAAAPAQVVEILGEFVTLQGAETLVRAEEVLEKVNLSFPFFDAVIRLPGSLRGLGLTFLTMLSPTITSVWHILPVLGNPDWYVFAVSSHAISWWVCLPLVVYAIYGTVRSRDIWWLGWSVSLVLWIVVSANARYGAGFDAFRYRDSLVPVSILLAAKGLDRTLYPVSASEARVWKYALRAYIVFVVFIILLAGVGIIGV